LTLVGQEKPDKFAGWCCFVENQLVTLPFK